MRKHKTDETWIRWDRIESIDETYIRLDETQNRIDETKIRIDEIYIRLDLE